MPLGRASFGPAQMAGLIWPDPLLKKNPKNFKNILKKNLRFFWHIFLPLLYNIGLYIYTVKYKSGIKIHGFLQNISKKSKKIIQNIFKKKKIFYCIRPNPKNFPSIFFIKKKTKIAFFSCFKKWISLPVHDYPLGSGQHVKNLFLVFFLGSRCGL
jgi:hypothetical protein